jgi:NAD(P)-dependent dehydrogenase (short-subunit alcohol dehydrogenase family)
VLEEAAALFEGRVVNEIKQIGGQAEYFLSDVSKEAYAKVTVEFTVKTFGKLYPAFNNAGIEGEFKPIHEQTEPKPPRWNPPRFRQLLQ